MVLALSLAEEAGVVATASEDGDACLVDFRQKDAVVKRFSGVAATARTAAAAAGVAEGQGWCGAVHADPRANWVTIAGGVDGPTESIGGGRESLGGWLATFYAPTGNLSRCFATKAPIRVLQPDATRGLLLAGGDNADLLTLPLHDCSSTAAPRRIRVPSPAIYSIAVGDAPGRLLRANQLDGDDSGAPPVVLTAGPAPFVSVSAGDQRGRRVNQSGRRRRRGRGVDIPRRRVSWRRRRDRGDERHTAGTSTTSNCSKGSRSSKVIFGRVRWPVGYRRDPSPRPGRVVLRSYYPRQTT